MWGCVLANHLCCVPPVFEQNQLPIVPVQIHNPISYGLILPKGDDDILEGFLKPSPNKKKMKKKLKSNRLVSIIII